MKKCKADKCDREVIPTVYTHNGYRIPIKIWCNLHIKKYMRMLKSMEGQVRRKKDDEDELKPKKRISKLLPLIVVPDERVKGIVRIGPTESRRKSAVVENERYRLAKEVQYWRRKARAVFKLIDVGQIMRKRRVLDE